MATSSDAPRLRTTRLAQLRHDLLNRLNVLTGATAALLETDLTDAQMAWVHMVRSTTERLVEIAESIDDDETTDVSSPSRPTPLVEGRARLADLLSIAAARVGKPFTREQLVSTIEQVAGRQPLRILLVDDSPELVLLVKTFLQRRSWDLDVVENGERAVAQATTEHYDVVLMDIDLPGLDGATAAHAIRAADLARGASPTPIIAMTAFDRTAAASVPPLKASDEEPDVVTIEDPDIAPLVPEFLELRRADVRMFREALGAGEFKQIQSSAHKMKGSGRGYGFSVVSRLGEDLERAAHEQDVATLTALVDELDAYLTRVQVQVPRGMGMPRWPSC